MDKRKQNTRERIRNAYLTLLSQETTGRITVTALARQANIDRKTFYLHYDTVEDVVYDYSRVLIERLIERLEEKGFPDSMMNINLFYQVMGQIINENLPFFRHLSLRPSMDAFWEKTKHDLAARMTELYRDRVLVKPEALNVYMRFLLGGVQELYRDWLRGQLPYSIEELGRIASDAAFEGFSQILK